MEPAVQIGLALITVLTLVLSGPKNKWLAILTAVLIILSGGWQAYDAYQKRLTQLEISFHVDRVLSRETARYLTVVRDMIFFSSDGWLPSTEGEFFSRRTVNLICSSLNIDLEAPVLPKRAWRQWIGESAEKYRNEINGIFQNYAQLLDADRIRLIRNVSDSLFLASWSAHIVSSASIDRQLGIIRRPALCPGLEPTVEEDLGKIRALYEFMSRNESHGQKIDWKWLNMRDDKRWPRHLLGSNRIDRADGR